MASEFESLSKEKVIKPIFYIDFETAKIAGQPVRFRTYKIGFSEVSANPGGYGKSKFGKSKFGK